MKSVHFVRTASLTSTSTFVTEIHAHFLLVQVTRNIIQPTLVRVATLDTNHQIHNHIILHPTCTTLTQVIKHIVWYNLKHSVCAVVVWQDLMSLTCNEFLWPCLTTVHNMFTSRHGVNWAYDLAHLPAWCCFSFINLFNKHLCGTAELIVALWTLTWSGVQVHRWNWRVSGPKTHVALRSEALIGGLLSLFYMLSWPESKPACNWLHTGGGVGHPIAAPGHSFSRTRAPIFHF